MYLHIGSDVVVREKEVIAIIGRRGDADMIINIASNNEKSFVLTEVDKVYISPISPHTLKKRSLNRDFREG